MRLRLARFLLFFAACLSYGRAQTVATQEAITGNLSGISTSSGDLLQVRFTLANCGTANPLIPGVSVIVPKTKIFTADASGNIAGTLWGNDTVSCNLGFTTVYQVQYLRNNVPTGVVAQYRVLAPVYPATSWNLTTAVPVSTLPPVNMPASGFQCPGLTPAMVGLLPDWTPLCAQLTAGSVTSVSTAPVASQTIVSPAGTTLAVDSLNNVLSANAQVGGVTLGDKLVLADKRLGSAPGIITIDAPGDIPANLTISANHAVHLRSNITVEGEITLSTGSSFSCSPQASISIPTTFINQIPSGGEPVLLAYLFSTSANGVSIKDCTIHGPTNFLAAYVLHVTGGSTDVSMTGNHVDEIGLFESFYASAAAGLGVKRLDIEDNTVTYAVQGAQPYTYPDGNKTTIVNAAGLNVFYVVNGRFSNNSFVNTVNGVEWWGGDAGTGGLSTGLVAGLTFTGNHCKSVYAACIWGSMGTDITVVGNTSDTNGDVAFDTEGGVRTLFVGNIASHCGNGCGVIYSSVKDIAFVGNMFEATGSNAFLGKNASVDPSAQVGVAILDNTITCSSACKATLLDAVSSLHFEGNKLVNAYVAWTSNCAIECSISRNNLNMYVPFPTATALLQVPVMLNNATLVVEGNNLRSTVAQPAGSIGILDISGDFNTPDYHFIQNNKIWNLPIGIQTTTNGGNIGVPTYWTIERNKINATTSAILHSAPNPNEIYRVYPSNTDFTGAPLTAAINVDQVAQAVSGTTAATIGAQVTTAVVFTNVTPAGFMANCSVYAQTGVPGIVNYSAFSGKTIQVTIQATTAAAASGVIVCKQQTN